MDAPFDIPPRMTALGKTEVRIDEDGLRSGCLLVSLAVDVMEDVDGVYVAL